MKRKVLIAVPESGSAKAKESATLAKKFFREFSRYDTLSTTDNYESYPLALGQSISVLVQMDMLILMAGWMTDIMCLSLHDVATRHGITIMTEDEFMASHSISFGEFATNYLIADIVAQEYFVSREDIFSRKRTQSVSDARQVIMYLAHKYLYMPYGEIAEYVGRSYNTTRYGIRMVKDRYLFDRAFFQKLNRIKDKINKIKGW